MEEVFIRVKGIIKRGENYLVLKKWVDDRIPDPFVWEFIDGVASHGESPDDAMLRTISETLGVEGKIEKLLYTWSQMMGDIQCVGIAYLVSADDMDEESIELPEEFGGVEWIKREQFDYYIENKYVLKDLERADL